MIIFNNTLSHVSITFSPQAGIGQTLITTLPPGTNLIQQLLIGVNYVLIATLDGANSNGMLVSNDSPIHSVSIEVDNGNPQLQQCLLPCDDPIRV